MKLLLSLLCLLFLGFSAFGQSRTVTAPNGQLIKIDGTDGFRGNDELWLYTAGSYAKKPTSNSGIDVYVVENKIVEIRDRAGIVFIQGKSDPGPIAVGSSGFVLSGHGAARRWILTNLKTGDVLGMDGKVPTSTVDSYAYSGYGMIEAATGKTLYFSGKNVNRTQDSVIYYTADYYGKTPPNDSGVDVLVTAGKISQINDRADAVYIQKKSDPGPVKADASSFVISGNGEGRKWIVGNLKVGDAIGVSGVDLSKEVAPMATVPCFDGAHYRKAVSSYDSWTGIAGFVRLGTPKVDETRMGEKTKQPLDNFSVYMGGNSGGKFEVDAGLTWEFTVDESGKKSERRNAFRPFWRTQKAGDWNSAPAKKEFYFYPGETVQMAILVAGPKKLRLVVSDGKGKTFQTDFDAEGFVAGAPRQFKRVNAIDQVGNEGKPVLTTKAEIAGSEWMQTVLLRGEGAAAQQLAMNASRFTDMRCTNGTVTVTTTDAAKGAEKIDLFGFKKN